MASSLFNPQTQYVEDVSSINKQVEASAAEDGAYYASLIKADAEYNMAQAKGMVTGLSDLLGKTAQFAKEEAVRSQERAESEHYEKAVDWKNNEYSLVWNDQKFIDGEAFNNAVKAKQTTVGAENLTPQGDGVLAGAMLLGDVEGENQKMLIRSRRDRYSEFFQVARGEQGVKIARGNGETFTLDSAKTYEERRIAERAIRGIWFRESIKDGSTATQRRRILHKEMRRVESAAAVEWDQAVKAGVKVAKNAKLEQELGEIVNGDLPGEHDVDANGDYVVNDFVASIERDRTWYDPISEGGTGDLGVTRKKKFDILNRMAETGSLDMATITKLGDSWFTGNDGQRHQIKSLWKKEYNALLAKGVKYRQDLNTVRKEEVQGEIDKFDLDKKAMLAEQDGPATQDQIDEIMDEFRSNNKWRGYPTPSVVTDYYTKQEEANDSIKERLLYKAAKKIPIDETELAGWSGDPAGLLALKQTIKVSNLSALNAAEVEKRDSEIKRITGNLLGETEALTNKSDEYVNTVEQATAFFNRRYGELLDENPGKKTLAWDNALKETRAGIESKEWVTKTIEAPNDATSKNVSRSYALISKDKGSINKVILPMVSEQDLETALENFENEGRGAWPASFRNLARKLSPKGNMTVQEVALGQVNVKLRAEGLPQIDGTDGSQVTKLMTEAFDVPDQAKLNSGSMSKQNQVIVKNAENLQAYLDIVKDGTAMNNGGHDYILSPDGGDAHLEKPLTEHTIEEVYGLIRSGHGNLTAYAMSPRQFVEAVQASGLEMTDILDANTQDTLALFVARANLKHQNDSTGFYGSNEIAKLSKEERGTYSTILGTVPDDWNKLENLVDSRLFK